MTVASAPTTLYSLAGDGRIAASVSGVSSALWDNVHDNTGAASILVDYTTANRTNLVGFLESSSEVILADIWPSIPLPFPPTPSSLRRQSVYTLRE